jgi:predicted transcriptional regulator
MKSMREKVGEDYGEILEIFSAKVEERRYLTYKAPDDLPRLATDTEKIIQAEEIKIIVKQRSELTRKKRLVYNLMWEQLSTQLHTEVQKHEKYEDFHRKDPLMFLKVITELFKTSIRGDEYKKKTEIKKLYYTIHQGMKTDISTYYEQFKNARQL